MRLIRRALAKGRIGRTRSFVAALGLAVAVLPVATAVAYFMATGTGTGTISNVQAGSAPVSVIAIAADGAYTYAGPSTTDLQPGGTVSFPLRFTCTTNCPGTLSTVNLSSWSSDKVGCDEAAFPGSFSMTTLTVNSSITAAGSGGWGPAVITWANLAVNQNSCAGAHFTYTLVTP